MSNFQPFLEHPNIYLTEYKTQKIGEGLDNPRDATRSHFINVSDYIDVKIKFKIYFLNFHQIFITIFLNIIFSICKII